MEKKYPQKFLKGISNTDFIKHGIVSVEVFSFSCLDRNDQMSESSITWYENDEALNIIMNQINERKNSIQFPGGVAVLDMSQLKLFLTCFPQEKYGFERSPTEYNKYHGNILLCNELFNDKQMKRMFCYALALAAGSNIIPQKDYCAE